MRSPADRRRKSDGEHLEHLIKTRFTDSELQEVERDAAMYHGGKLAPTVREYALLGMQVARERRRQLVRTLQAPELTSEIDRDEAARLLADIAERQLLSNMLDERKQA